MKNVAIPRGLRLGAHMPTAGGLDQAVLNGKTIGCATIQIFTKSPSQWKSRPLESDRIEAFHRARAKTRIDPVIVHDSYLINLASPDRTLRNRSIEALCEEIRRAAQLGAACVVKHMGAHMGTGETAGLKRLAASLRRVLTATQDVKMSIALETTAGQGTSLGYRFEHIREVLDLLDGDQRVVVCLDTCHLFAAGYDFRSPTGYENTVNKLDAAFGINRVAAMHINDSVKPCGSRVDRHAHIGKGYVGAEGFRHWLHDARWAGVPMIIETPEANRMHKINLRRLRRLANS